MEDGEVIESYPNDFPYPSFLKIGLLENRPVHVVYAENSGVEVDIRKFKAVA